VSPISAMRLRYERGERRPRSIDPALHRTRRASRDHGGRVIAEAGRSDEIQRLLMGARELFQAGSEILGNLPPVLIRRDRDRTGMPALGVLLNSLGATNLVVELIAQDGGQPSRKVRAFFKGADVRDGARQRFLNEVVRLVSISAKRNCKGAKLRNRADDGIFDFRVRNHGVGS
jgi:hypothetical protein